MLNVVSPPRKPTVKKSFKTGGIADVFCIVNPKIYPIRKQPAMFENKVPQRPIPKNFVEIFEIRYLSTAPSPPPVKTAIIFSMRCIPAVCFSLF